jgi:hypothetical protein
MDFFFSQHIDANMQLRVIHGFAQDRAASASSSARHRLITAAAHVLHVRVRMLEKDEGSC